MQIKRDSRLARALHLHLHSPLHRPLLDPKSTAGSPPSSPSPPHSPKLPQLPSVSPVLSVSISSSQSKPVPNENDKHGRMVHLATVKNDSELLDSTIKRVETINLDPPGEDDFYSSVYGSRYAAEELPSTEMPEKEMPRDVAYRMIKDELSLDGNPMLKYACLLFFISS